MNNYRTTLTAYIPASLREKLENAAKAENISQSELVRRLLENGLKAA